MAYKIPKFLKRKDDSLLFSSTENEEFVFYVPEIYFERKDAIIVGEYVNLLGILDYTIFNKNGKHSGLKTFYFPTVFLSKPYTIEKLKNVKLTENSDIQDYRLLKFKNGDPIVVSVKVPQTIENVEEFYKLFLTGHLPTTISYDRMQNYFIDSMKLNGFDYGISLQMFGIVISEMCRDKNDITKPFRLSKESNMKNYKAVSIKDIPKIISPYASITSENWDEAVVNAITTKGSKNSPMEKLLMD